MYYQIEGYMNMETITFEEESQGGYEQGSVKWTTQINKIKSRKR